MSCWIQGSKITASSHFYVQLSIVCPLTLCPCTTCSLQVSLWAKSVDRTTSQRFSFSTCTSLFLIGTVEPLEARINYPFSHFKKTSKQSSVFSYWEWSCLDGVDWWTLGRVVPHGSVGVQFRETLPNHSEHIHEAKSNNVYSYKRNDIQWRNSLAVLIHKKRSFKSLQDVSVLSVSDALQQTLKLCSAEMSSYDVNRNSDDITLVKGWTVTLTKQKTRYKNPHLTILMHSRGYQCTTYENKHLSLFRQVRRTIKKLH